MSWENLIILLPANSFPRHFESFAKTFPDFDFDPASDLEENLLPSQIVLLANRHTLCTKDIIRSNKMEEEVRKGEIENIVCFYQPAFALLSLERDTHSCQ